MEVRRTMATETAMWRGRRWMAAAALVALAGSLGACGSDDEDTADFCEKYRTFEDENEQVAQGNAEDPENVDLEDVKEQFSTLNDQIEELAGEAPDEIKDDVETVRDAFAEVADSIEQAESPEELSEATTAAAEDEEATEASDRVDEWVQDNCDSDGAR
jgi:TolA-binding protein